MNLREVHFSLNQHIPYVRSTRRHQIGANETTLEGEGSTEGEGVYVVSSLWNFFDIILNSEDKWRTAWLAFYVTIDWKMLYSQ